MANVCSKFSEDDCVLGSDLICNDDKPNGGRRGRWYLIHILSLVTQSGYMVQSHAMRTDYQLALSNAE